MKRFSYLFTFIFLFSIPFSLNAEDNSTMEIVNMIKTLKTFEIESNTIYNSYYNDNSDAEQAIVELNKFTEEINQFKDKYFKFAKEAGITDESALFNFNVSLANIYFNIALIHYNEKSNEDKIHFNLDKVIALLFPIYQADDFTDVDFYHLESAYGIKMMLSRNDVEKVFILSKSGIDIGSKNAAFYQAYIESLISKELYNETLPYFKFIIDNKMLEKKSLAALYHLRGTVYEKLEKEKEALKDFKKAKRLGYKEK